MKAPKARILVRQRPTPSGDVLAVTDVRTAFTQLYRHEDHILGHYTFPQAAKDLRELSRRGAEVRYLAA